MIKIDLQFKHVMKQLQEFVKSDTYIIFHVHYSNNFSIVCEYGLVTSDFRNKYNGEKYLNIIEQKVY